MFSEYPYFGTERLVLLLVKIVGTLSCVSFFFTEIPEKSRCLLHPGVGLKLVFHCSYMHTERMSILHVSVTTFSGTAPGKRAYFLQ
jgi:hypothetical protein